MSLRYVALWAVFLASMASGRLGFAAESAEIHDNSFLIEEAYNQEPGVVQHIQSFHYVKDGSWTYSFTQEWPVPRETHQLSYTVPVLRVTGPDETGFGDVALNYRYQAIWTEEAALAPRFSLLLPTGDYKKGLGAGALGFQVSLPASFELYHKLVINLNAGSTFVPGSRATDGSHGNTLGFNYGASLIWLMMENFNLMFEAVGSSGQIVEDGGHKSRSHTFLLNPGLRFAINFRSGLQIVPGIAFPIGIGPSHGEYGVFAYLSFEHPLFSQFLSPSKER